MPDLVWNTARLVRTVERFELDEPIDLPCGFGPGHLQVHAVERHQLHNSGATVIRADAHRVDGQHVGSRAVIGVDDDNAARLNALLPPVPAVPTTAELAALTVDEVNP